MTKAARGLAMNAACTCVLALVLSSGSALAQTTSVGRLLAQTPAADAGAPTQTAQAAPAASAADATFPAERLPKLSLSREPNGAVNVGESVKLTLRADAVEGDDVTLPEQSFAALELVNKTARVEPAKSGRQVFVFELELMGLEAGTQTIEGVQLRIVTRDGQLGETKSEPVAIEVKSLLGNEPNATLKEATQPVTVVQDDYTLLYVGGGLLAALVIGLLAVFGYRYWQRRVRPAPPPPPPRPAWEIAAEKLAALRRKKPHVLAEGHGAQFVDEASDVVREYLGGHFGFDGLETTSDEMMAKLRRHGASDDLLKSVGTYLRRCDLVKFAKVEPDDDALTVVLADAQAIVELRGARGREVLGGPTPIPGIDEAPDAGSSSTDTSSTPEGGA